ncbi:MAG: prepilin-type N-terminal cleavage/methylation domain-containing protein [Thermomonas sp.]|uniref:PilW family protein n=1 Tax=Thermomonas sp. TaxID=1971895 RepID=UPI001EB6214B|nr:prepilin-type N-terminal cleavage/methylation domain-containing protein [Thermomonas sp.]MBV2209088.1 prepilin-type N-terminal cleavage/methylation domain-containing protein [Thermomonas sp.]
MSRPSLQRLYQAGFSLIELMIAMVLGLLVLGAAIAIFQSNQNTFNANEGQNRIQEGARVAYELMSRDIRAAGGTACSYLARPDVEHALTADETALLSTPLSGSGSEFTAVSADDAGYQVTGATTSTVTLKKPAEGLPDWKLSDAFANNDKAVICNASQLYVVTVTNVNDGSNTLTFSPATPVAIYNKDISPAASVSAARYRSNRWYLDGGALKVQRNGAAGQEVITGVTGMTVSYLRNSGNAYTSTPAQWNDVIAMRVNLTLRGQKTMGGDVKVDGNNYITRQTSNVISIRSRP